ncbi:MAG TPA: S-layer family protein, partial [Burkholderiaceae bacterium]|nr:S-layer family protein [Burkholderiaceae bacterium]
AGHLSLDAASGDINASGATLAAQTLTAHAGQTLRTDQARVLAGQIQVNAHDLSNIQGEIVQVGTGNLMLTLHGTLDNTQGLIAADQTLASKTLAITNTGGTMIAGQRLEVDSASLTGDGKLFSQGDLNVKLVQNYTHTGELQANGNAHLETSGTLINQSTLLAGTALQLKAATIDNQANGQISASKLALDATHTLTNRGLIDGEETIIETATLNNRGTGRIYGNHVAIGAATVTNDAENGSAPVIAARGRLDIAAETIANREHALIFSAGDLAMGGSLDTNKQAIGQAGAVNNASATIEALGNLDISARQINNTNEHFSTTVEFFGPEYVVEYQGSGSANRYLPGTPGVYIYNNESDYLMTPEGSYENWLAYGYYRTATETKVLSSDPGQILSGGAMALTADSLLNDKSRVIAGGTLTGNIGTLTNTEVPGERTITDSGAVTSYWRDYQKGRDSTGSSTAGYNPPTVIQAISLTPTVYQQNAHPGGTGTQVAAVSAISQVDALNTVVRTGGVNTAIPNNSLFSLSPNPSAGYLIETDRRFSSYRDWLSSDYLLNALSIDPATMQKRLGDGFYEQKLIREQVAQLTGRRFLDGYASDEAQYQALLNNAATFAQAHDLRPGVALSAEQMAALTSDIVWLVEQDVILADGQTVRALVPQLYVRVQDGDLHAAGALIAGSDIHLDIAGDLVNSGTIAGRNVVALSADNVKNLGGRIAGNDVGVAARTDFDNLGGLIEAGNSLTAIAGRDLNLRSSTRTQSNAQGSRTQIDRVAALYVTGSSGTLIAAAGRDVNLAGAVLVNAAATDGTPAGSTAIAAGRDLNLATVAEAASNSLAWDGGNHRQDSSRSEVGTTIRTQGDLRLQAGNDLNARAADVSSEQGALLATAGRDVNLTAAELNRTVDEAHQHTGSSSAFSRTTITTRDTLDETTTQGTTLSGAACPRSERRSLATRHAVPAWPAQNKSQYRCFCSSICRSDGQNKTGAARSAQQADPANDRCARRTHCRDRRSRFDTCCQCSLAGVCACERGRSECGF